MKKKLYFLCYYFCQIAVTVTMHLCFITDYVLVMCQNKQIGNLGKSFKKQKEKSKC